jgi:hypothetical protein
MVARLFLLSTIKTMKKILSTLVALVCATATFAQVSEVQTATLIHGDKTSVFYGIGALTEAYNAAAEDANDVIILSQGTFDLETIQKSISIYGVGMDEEPWNFDNVFYKTYIRGRNMGWDWYCLHIEPFEYYDDYGEKSAKMPVVHLEGILTDLNIPNGNTPLNNLEIVKSAMNIRVEGESYNTTIRQSVIGFVEHYHGIAHNLNVYNSFIGGFYVPLTSSVNVDHCIIKGDNIGPGIGYYTNNIIYRNVSAQSTAYNNIFVGDVGIESPNTQENNWFNIANDAIWAVEGEDGSYGPTKTYELKFPKKYVGTDGTVVGPAGGQYPWNVIPCLPRIISSDIDARVAADGKLKVSLKVEAQTKE